MHTLVWVSLLIIPYASTDQIFDFFDLRYLLLSFSPDSSFPFKYYSMKNYSSLVIIMLILGCSPPDELSIKPAINLTGTLIIPLDSSINPEMGSLQYMDTDSGEYLALLNKTVYGVELFNLNTEKHTKRIKLEYEGPNGVGTTNGFRIFSPDTLLVASLPPELRIMDIRGNLKASIPVQDPDNYVRYLASNIETPFLFDGKVLFGAQPYFRNFFDMGVGEISDHVHVYRVDLTSGEVTWLPVSNPPDIWKEGKKLQNFTWTDRYDSIIVSSVSDHRLWVISKKEGKLLERKEVPSSYVKQYHIINGRPLIGDKGIIESLAGDRYDLILHDPYRDVFYRFFLIGVDYEDYEIGLRELYSYRPKIGLMLLGANLETIGEYVFENNYAENLNYFVGRQGLYISTNNPNRDDYNENILRYDIIQFSGMEYED